MIAIPHRTASGRLDEGWELDPEERCVLIQLRRGGLAVSFRVEVCSSDAPRVGAQRIERVDGETWRLLPERYIRIWPNGIEKHVAIDCPINAEVGPGQQIRLTNTPSDVSAILEVL